MLPRLCQDRLYNDDSDNSTCKIVMELHTEMCGFSTQRPDLEGDAASLRTAPAVSRQVLASASHIHGMYASKTMYAVCIHHSELWQSCQPLGSDTVLLVYLISDTALRPSVYCFWHVVTTWHMVV